MFKVNIVKRQNITYIQYYYLIRSHKAQTLDKMAKLKQIFVN